MTVPRAMSALAVGLLLVVALTLALLWSRNAIRHPSEDARSGDVPACAPLNPNGPPPADCPQARPPSGRTP